MDEQLLLFDFLQRHTIPYQLFKHQPVFTINDKPIVTAIDGKATTSSTIVPEPHWKTLFLKTKNNHYFLISVVENKRVDLKALSEQLGCERFSFGSAQELQDILKLLPGSVTPYGLLFDTHKQVHFVLDEEALQHTTIGFHPLRNDMTIVMDVQDFLQCITIMEHTAQIIAIPTK